MEDLNLLMSNAGAIAQMHMAATDSGLDLQAVLYYCAFGSAVAKDATAINGDMTPMRDPRTPVIKIQYVFPVGNTAVAFACPQVD